MFVFEKHVVDCSLFRLSSFQFVDVFVFHSSLMLMMFPSVLIFFPLSVIFHACSFVDIVHHRSSVGVSQVTPTSACLPTVIIATSLLRFD